MAAHLRQQVSENQVDLRSARVECQRKSQARFRSWPIPLATPLQVRENELCLGRGRTCPGCSRRCLASSGEHLGGRRVAVEETACEHPCDRCPGQRVVWVELSGSSVVLDRTAVGRRRPLILEVATPKVQIVCIGALRLPARQRLQTARREAEPDLLGDGGAQLALQAQHTRRLAVVGLGPHLHLVPDSDQCGRHA